MSSVGASPIIIQADGWQPVNEVWAYASASTITVPTNATARFCVGDRIKLNNTTTKYFYVVAVAATTLTVAAGSDYTVANVAISAIFVSHGGDPVDFPSYFNWIPTFTGFSANPTGGIYTFMITGKRVFFDYMDVTNGTSNSTSYTGSLPLAAKSQGGLSWILKGSGFNNGVYVPQGWGNITSASSVIVFSTVDGTVPFTASGAKGMFITGASYLIA